MIKTAPIDKLIFYFLTLLLFTVLFLPFCKAGEGEDFDELEDEEIIELVEDAMGGGDCNKLNSPYDDHKKKSKKKKKAKKKVIDKDEEGIILRLD